MSGRRQALWGWRSAPRPRARGRWCMRRRSSGRTGCGRWICWRGITRSITTGYFYNHSRSRNAVSAAADCGRIRPRHRQIGPHGRCPAGMRRRWRRTANTDTQTHQDGRRYRQMGSALRSRAGDLGLRPGKGGVELAASSTSRAIRLTFRRPAIGAGFRRAHPGGKAR